MAARRLIRVSLTPSNLFARLENIKINHLAKGQLVPHIIEKYDQRVILEVLHNCIAHQNYHQHARITVSEHPDKIVFLNEGNFFDGEPEDYLLKKHTPNRYRNTF